jgi:hypothetical protein
MTIAHVEKFAELVGQDPALYAKFGWEKINEIAVSDMPAKIEWMSSAVNQGKALGLDFNADEALIFLEKTLKASAGDELSDLQLEAVAGGKDKPGAKFADDGRRNLIFGQVARDAKRTGNVIASWFKGW